VKGRSPHAGLTPAHSHHSAVGLMDRADIAS
jgi:hypothetical protein